MNNFVFSSGSSSEAAYFQASEPSISARVSYSDGTKYEGEIQNGMRCGLGKLTTRNPNWVYEGIFRDDYFIEGAATIRLSCGGRMAVIWKEGKETVEMAHYANGDLMYAGESENVGETTYGISVEPTQSAYVGSKISEKTQQIFQNGVWIESLEKSMERGIIYADGKPVSEVNYLEENILYEGEIPQGDELHYGRMTQCDRKQTYIGTFRKYIYQGVGVLECPDFRYIGHWEKGLPEGEGIVFYAKGSSFVKYRGQFERGDPSGYGEMEYRNGDIYRGFWKQRQRQGKGTLQHADGTIQNGRWEKDSLCYVDFDEEVADKSYDSAAFSDSTEYSTSG